MRILEYHLLNGEGKDCEEIFYLRVDLKFTLYLQKIYLRDRPHDKSDSSKMSWGLPIVMIRSDNLDFTKTTPIAWMKGREALNLDNMPDKEHFIIVNPEEIGKD